MYQIRVVRHNVVDKMTFSLVQKHRYWRGWSCRDSLLGQYACRRSRRAHDSRVICVAWMLSRWRALIHGALLIRQNQPKLRIVLRVVVNLWWKMVVSFQEKLHKLDPRLVSRSFSYQPEIACCSKCNVALWAERGILAVKTALIQSRGALMKTWR